MICALYFAFSQVHISHSEGVSIVGVSLGLAAVYCAFLFFLFSMRRVLSHKILFLIVESLGMLWFLAVAWWWPNAWMLVAGLALFSVIVGYTANKAVQRIAEKSGSR